MFAEMHGFRQRFPGVKMVIIECGPETGKNQSLNKIHVSKQPWDSTRNKLSPQKLVDWALFVDPTSKVS